MRWNFAYHLAFFFFAFWTPGESCAQKTINADLTPVSVLRAAYQNHTSSILVTQVGTIISILPDDNSGNRHQRMIVRLSNGQTLLIAHNIDLAPRIPNPAKGARLTFHGEYEWNAKGGVIHWTHCNPGGAHANGWLEYSGKRYE
jgi:hypothetical protein